MLKQEKITKPIQIVQYHGSASILLVPDIVVNSNVDINNATLSVHINGIVLLTNQTIPEENGMYKYTGTLLEKYYFDFFQNTKKIYKVTKDSSYIVYNGPTDPFNQFNTIDDNDTLIVVQNNTAELPYLWYEYDQIPDPKIRFNEEIITNNLCAFGISYDNKNHDMILDLKGLPSQPIVFTSEIYNGDVGQTYHIVTDLIQFPDINYKNIVSYTLTEEDFTIDTDGNLILNQALVAAGLNGTGKLQNWKVLKAADPNFLNNYLFIITTESNSKAYYYNTSLNNPYSSLSQDLVRYPFSVDTNSSNIIHQKKYYIQNSVVTTGGLDSSIFINSSLYAQQTGMYEVRTRLFSDQLNLLGEDRFVFNIKTLSNMPTPTPTPTPSGKKHTVVFDAGPILNIDNCEDCYKDFLSATVTNMSTESRYYYEFGVFAYGNANPDEPRDTTDSDDITFTTASGIINNGLTTETIKTLITTGIGKIRTTLYVKVINLDNYITSTAYLTIEKCNRDFCATTPTPTPSKALKSYPPRTPTKTKTPTPTQTSTKTPTPTPTPTTPLNPPNAPTNLSGVAGNAIVTLSWTAPSSSIVRDYTIQYSSNSGSTWTTFSDGTSVSTTAVVTGLANGTAYLFRVAATNGAGSSAYLTTQSAITPIANAPNAPVITSVSAGNGQVILNWTAPANGGAAITDYVIDYSTNVGATWTNFDHPPSTSTSATITGLTNGLSYIFRVAAVNSTGTGQYSLYSQAAVPATLSDAPTSVSASISGTNINVSWQSPTFNGGAAITDYVIQYSSNAGTSWTTFSDATSAVTNTVVTGLALGSTYIFRVAAVNKVGSSVYSVNSSPLFFALVPSAPASIQAISTNNSIQLSWSTPNANGSAIIDFTVQVSANNGSSWTTVSSTHTANIITIGSPTVDLGSTYMFRVAARNTIGLGSYATSASVTLYPQGQLLSWGANTSSQLGDGFYQSRNLPQPLTKQWTKLAIYNSEDQNYSILAIDINGELYGWGQNSNGVIGNGSVSSFYTPQRIGTQSNWTSIAIGNNTSYAINSSGELYSWGTNTSSFLLGLGSGGPTYSYTPTRIGTATDWVKVVVGENFAAALNSNGELYTWGANNYGQLGIGSVTVPNATPTRIGQSLTWTDVGAGGYHLIAIASNGEMYGTGYNVYGSVGDGTTVNKSSLTRIGTASNWSKIECGYYHNLAINTAGQLFGWGWNNYGQVGVGSTSPSSVIIPTQIGASSNWNNSLFSAGYEHSIAVNSLGEIYAWGRNDYGQLADSTTTPKYVTNRVPNITSTNITSIAASRWASWLINSNSLLYSGYVAYTASGSSYTFTNLGTATSAALANNYTQVSAGSTFTTACNNIGQLYVWGGISSTYANSVFNAVNINNLTSADASLGQTSPGSYLALDTVGGLWAGGYGPHYPYWNGSNLTSVNTVNHGLGSITKVASGYAHSLVIASGKLYAGGNNSYGALGIGSSSTSASSYLQIGTASNWIEVDAGEFCSAAINNIGELYTWGYNNIGQLGLGDTTNRSTPTRVGLLSNWVKIAVGKDFMLAINSLGEIWAWGSNTSGQLGIGNVPYTFVPTKVGTATNWTSVSAGGSHTLAINSSKQLWAWGLNSSGQLGDNTTTNRNTPVRIGSTRTWLAASAGLNHSIGIIQS